MAKKISLAVVKAAKPREKPYFIWDAVLMGFGARVAPSGTTSYVYQYRNQYGHSRRITLGKHGTITAEAARAKAQELAAKVIVHGHDPVEEKKERRTAKTVGDVLTNYLRSVKFSSKAESTKAVDRGRIEHHLRATLGRKVLVKLKREDVRAAFEAIKAGKTAVDVKTCSRGRSIVRGGEGTARAAIRLLRAILTWAVEEGYVEANVAKGIKIGADARRDVLLDAEQYANLFRAVDQMQEQLELRHAIADAIRVIALCGCRRGEIAGLQWRHVDLKRGLLILPPSRHKTGGRTGKSREIALPAAAQVIIARQLSGAPDDLVFPPERGEGVANLSHFWRKVRERAGLPADVGLHGLRHSLASLAAAQGAQAGELMAMLGWTQLSTASRYVHFQQDTRVRLMDKHTATISALMLPPVEPAPVAEVVPLPVKESA